jgi:putative intracellular protease/amidase
VSVNVTRSVAKRVLMVVANPAVSTTTGWPVGFWASELPHPWYEFREVGYEVVFASPGGGKVDLEGYDVIVVCGDSRRCLLSARLLNGGD